MSDDDAKRARGGCLCGAVRFAVAGALRPVTFCHCSQCRKQTGLYYAATAAPRDAVSVTGEDAITWFAASDHAERGFCSTCGSALFWREIDGERLSILAGSFDRQTELRADKHIFVADKPNWYELADALPKRERDG